MAEIMVPMYLAERLSAKGSGRPLTLDKAVDRTCELSKREGPPYRIRERSEKRWGVKMTLPELRKRLPNRMEDVRLNDALLIDNDGDDDEMVRVRRVMRPVDPLDLVNCTDSCEVLIYFLRERFPKHMNLGWFNCRRISGSSSWSQHAFGNAYDAGGPYSLVKDMGAALVAAGNRGDIPCAEVIFDRKRWTPESGVRPYTGSDPHTSHIHTSGRPYRTGTPACA